MNRLAIAIAFALSSLGYLALAQNLPNGNGKDITEEVCGSCHVSSYILSRGRATRAEWVELVDAMIAFGSTADQKQIQATKDYLTKTFGKVNVNEAPSAEISDVLGITPSQADAIVAYRTEHGAFKTISDLKNVAGLDSANLDSKRDRVGF